MTSAQPQAHRAIAILVAAAAFAGSGAEKAFPQQAEPVSGRVQASDGELIAYEIHGSGSPALVLVHGWSCDRRYWKRQVPRLSEHFKVVTVDLGGHGASGSGRDQWTIESFGGDVAAVVDHIGLDQVVLVGHSMGGDVVLEAAGRVPGRVLGVVWGDTYSQLGSPRTRAEIEQILVGMVEIRVPARQGIWRWTPGWWTTACRGG